MASVSEVLPGVLHWSAVHPKIRQVVHSYYVQDAAVAIDPMVPSGVIKELASRRPPERILLTNRHHLRQSDALVAEFGCTILCPRSGLHEFDGAAEVDGYAYGDELAPGITAHEVGAICPDDAALHIRAGGGLLAFADGLIRSKGELGFVPDFLMGDDPEGVKRGLLQSLRRLSELDFDGMLFAHGEPLLGGARDALTEFVASPRTASF